MTLSDKVSRMKILVKSIIRYYQAELLRDVSEMKLNIVQMCIGNKQEIIRFVLLLVGIIANEECCRE